MKSLLLAILIWTPLYAAKQPALITAIHEGNVAEVRKLLRAGSSPNIQEIRTSVPSFSDQIPGGAKLPGRSALGVAIDKESVPLVKLLLDHRAKLNALEGDKSTPLIDACRMRNLEIVKLLLAKGANPNLPNGYGDTAIVEAANNRGIAILRALVIAGAKVSGDAGGAALDMAVQSSTAEVVKFLLDRGANPNYREDGGWTPLEHAVRGYDDDIVALLKKAGGKGRSKEALDREVESHSQRYGKELDAERAKKAAANVRFAKLMQEDTAVIQAAVADMATYQGNDLGFADAAGVQRVMMLDHTLGMADRFTESQMNSELNEVQALSFDLLMRKDFLRRNEVELSLTGCQFTDNRVALRSDDFIRRGPSLNINPLAGFRGWVCVYLPGYSDDGDRAILRFTFGPTVHGANGSYLLRKKAGKWQVVWRHFATYV